MTKTKKILITGLFLNQKNQHLIYRTASDQLAELLQKNQYPIIKTSYQPNRYRRLLDTCVTAILKFPQYQIAIVPFFGGYRSLVLQAVVCFLLKILGKKTILILHGGGIPMYMASKPKRYLAILKTADVLLAPSNFLIHEMKRYGLKVELIENVLNLSDYLFHPKEEIRPNLFWMRTFEDIYNPQMAVRVYSQLKQQYPNAKLIMAGRDAGMLTATKELAKELNVLQEIEMPGYVTLSDKNSLANEFDIYICTNSIDNAPVTIIEMMALGLVVISTNAGGIPYITTHNKNAVLVNINDDKAMLEAIIQVINNKVLAKQLINNAALTVKQYDEKPVLHKWQMLFMRLGYN